MARYSLVPTWFRVTFPLLVTLLSCLVLAAGMAAQEPSSQEPSSQELGDPQKAAQETASEGEEQPAKEGAVPAEDVAAAEAAFEAKFAEWKELMTNLRKLRTDYQTAEAEQRQAMSDDWDRTIAKAEELLPALIDTVVAAYKAAPNEDRVKTNFLVKVLADYTTRDLYEEALAIGRVLYENGCEFPEVFRDTGVAAFAMNDYDLMAEMFAKAEKLNALAGDALVLRNQIETYTKSWETEKELRSKEAEADDLPRVKLTTTKGDIVVELFENEAPGTVGNFVSLVKKGYYDDLTFHRVLAGFMAQAGCPEGDGTGGPGYTIYDECAKPGFRRHFRGVLSMAKTNAPNSGGSQFFITFRPTPHLDGQHTVFGRVIEGMDVVNRLQRRDPANENPPEPDKIIKAEVLRDRGHEYAPNKVE